MTYLYGILKTVLVVGGVAFGLVLILSFFTKPAEKPYWRHTYDNWMAFALLLQTLVLSTLLGILYMFIVPFFWLFFLRSKDLLGTRLEGESYWQQSSELDHSLRRTYKLY